MNRKTITWIATTCAAAVAGAGVLYVKVKSSAIKHLNMHGAFDDARKERIEALRKLPGALTDESLKQSEIAANVLLEEDASKKRQMD